MQTDQETAPEPEPIDPAYAAFVDGLRAMSDHELLVEIVIEQTRTRLTFEQIQHDFAHISAAVDRIPGAKLFGRRVIGGNT